MKMIKMVIFYGENSGIQTIYGENSGIQTMGKILVSKPWGKFWYPNHLWGKIPEGTNLVGCCHDRRSRQASPVVSILPLVISSGVPRGDVAKVCNVLSRFQVADILW